MRMQQFFFGYNEFLLAFEILFTISGLLLFMYKSSKWIYYVLMQYRLQGEMTIEEFTCTKNIIILFVTVLVRLIVTFCNSNTNNTLVVLLVTQNFAALLVLVLHEYVLRSRVTRMEVYQFFSGYFILILQHFTGGVGA